MAYSTFVHFTSADSGAPVLAATNGSGITWLDWILVTKGGWTKIFSGTNSAIYQMPGGSGRVIRAVHDSAVSGSTGKMTVRGAGSASGINTISNPFPLVAGVSDVNSTWTIVAGMAYEGDVTESYVQIMANGSGTTWTLYDFFGDAVPVVAGDTNNTVIRVNNNASTANGFTGCISVPTATVSLSGVPVWSAYATYDGATLAPIMGCFNPGGSTTLGNVGASTYLSPEPISGRVPFNEISLSDTYSTAGTWSSTNGAVRRLVIPNAWQGLCSAFAAGWAQRDTFQDTAYNAAASFTVFAGASTPQGTNSGIFYLETTNTWALQT